MENKVEYTPITRRLHVLLAEDDKADRLLFSEVLEELPVSVELTTVADGEELIDWLTRQGSQLPDVLFLDLNMPRRNGYAALSIIKRDRVLQDLPVIIFSTASDEDNTKQAYKDAAHYYIHKPTDFSKLKLLIYKALKLIAEKNISLPNKDNFVLKTD